MEYDSSSKDNDSSTKDNDSSSKGRYADCEWKSPVVESGLLHSPEIIRSVGTQRSGKNLLLPPVQNGPKRPTNTRVIQLLKRSRNVVNHSYVDYSLVPYRPADNVLPDSIDGMNFPQKLHLILDHSEARDLAVWLPHGRAFKIINPTKFEKIVCPKYFGHKRYSSFLNQVGVHGFKVITRARDRNCFYSQLFLKGLPHLTKYMPAPHKVFRNLMPDPDFEPDFDTIALIAPLPIDVRYGKPLTIDDILSFCQKTGRDQNRVLHQFYALLYHTKGNEVVRQRLAEALRQE